jgi:hypothetical protein
LNNCFAEACGYASKRRQGGKVETHVDLSEQPLVSGRETCVAEEVVIAVIRMHEMSRSSPPARSVDQP